MGWSKDEIKEYQKKYRQRKKENMSSYRKERRFISSEERRAESIKKANEKWMNT